MITKAWRLGVCKATCPYYWNRKSTEACQYIALEVVKDQRRMPENLDGLAECPSPEKRAKAEARA